MSEKPIRDYDRFILRLPDGLKDRLQHRAAMNGRSMNAEVVDMLERVMVEEHDDDITILTRTLSSLRREAAHATLQAQTAEEQLKTVLNRLRAVEGTLRHRLGDGVGDADLIEYATRVRLNRKVRERKEGETGNDPDALSSPKVRKR